MDFLQIGLVFLILLLAVFLSVLGIQVFFILKDLKRSLDKMDEILDGAEAIDGNGELVAQEVKPISKTTKLVIAKKSVKPVKRLFKRR